MSSPDYDDAIALLEKLIAFDTTSRNSNLALVEWVESYLTGHDIASVRVANGDGSKANLYATIGPMVDGGVILSGHSDVVPVDGQDWATHPFSLTLKDGRYFGRGSCDMKGFIALALAAVPLFKQGSKPVHLAISYDEEVGCIGAPAMIAQLAQRIPAPRLAIVGEPSMMKVINGHKGISVHAVEVIGHETHSSLTHLGLSANMVAVELMHSLAELGRELFAAAPENSPFMPPHPTLTIGLIHGGTASNILARRCSFLFDLRCPPGFDVDSILAPFKAQIAALNTEMKSAFPDSGIAITQRSNSPPMMPMADRDAEDFVRALTGDNSPAGAVAYGAEGGLFQQAGFPTVICGPGSIEQAHQPNEYIAAEQMQRGWAFMERLAAALK